MGLKVGMKVRWVEPNSPIEGPGMNVDNIKIKLDPNMVYTVRKIEDWCVKYYGVRAIFLKEVTNKYLPTVVGYQEIGYREDGFREVRDA